jgi:preprotein translocase subunit SecD
VIINERIREEVRNGRTPLNAMDAGFRRAFATIVDSNATGLLAYIMLFTFGAGPVRGFAIAISIGILTSLFTSTMLARLMMAHWWARMRPQALPV